MMPTVPITEKEMKDMKEVNILVDDITENDLKLPMPAKRRHSCLPGLLDSDSAKIGRRNSLNRQCNKKEPWYPISI